MSDRTKTRRWFDAYEFALFVAFSPLWVPLRITKAIRMHLKVRPFICGTVEQSWERCGEFWRESGYVCQNAYHTETGFGHQLAMALARRHHRKKDFFLAKVADPDPVLAAYAFKCLIRVMKPSRDDLPAGSLNRTETIQLLWADLISEESLGDYFESWFRARNIV